MRTLGGWLSVGDPLVVEAVARAGFDVVGLDLQHGGVGLQEASRVLQVLDLVGVPSIVRLSSEELGSMPRYLDFGAAEAMVATVDAPETAQRAIRLARYQPDGDRSEGGRRFGLVPDDRAAQPPPRVWAMIETLAGLESVEAIAGVPGLHGLAVGPADLARALGVPGHARRQDAGWCAAVERVLAATRARGLAACMFAADGAEAAAWFEAGFDRVILSNDLDLLRAGMRREILASGRVSA